MSLLDLDIVKALILSVQIFTHFDQVQVRTLSLETLWRHSLSTGGWAKGIAEGETTDRKVADEEFLAGLLHDVGKLVFAANLPERYSAARVLAQEQGLPDWEAEQTIFGATHAAVGAYLLGLWGLPDPLIEAVAFHHHPALCPDRSFSPLTAVHVANALVHAQEQGDAVARQIDQEYLDALGLRDRLAIWCAQGQLAVLEEQQI